MYSKKQKALALFVCVVFVAVAALSLLFLAKEANHECQGGHCSVCAHMEQAEQTLRQLFSGVTVVAAPLCAATLAAAIPVCVSLFVLCATPIRNKVRLNN